MKKEQLEKLVYSNKYQNKIIAATKKEIFKYPKLVKLLVNEKHKYIPQALALNKDLFNNLNIAKKLLNNVNFVSETIVKRKDLFSKGKKLIPIILKYKNLKLRKILAAHPSLFKYPEVFKKLTNDKKEVCFELVKNKKLLKYPDILKKVKNKLKMN
jgi:hypothetical protein